MLPRALAGVVAPLCTRAFARNTPALTVMVSRLGHYGPPANYRRPVMDDMPVPCGSWKDDYENKQRKYNIHLLFGVGFFIMTIFVGTYSGALNLYIFVPDQPAPRKS